MYLIKIFFRFYGLLRKHAYNDAIKKAKIGENVIFDINNFDDLYPELIEIGDNSVIATGAKILTHDAISFVSSGENVKKPVKIGKNVFVGFNSIIMPGVTIGDNVIVSAGSVVTKSVPDNKIIGGNPARIIGTRWFFMNEIKKFVADFWSIDTENIDKLVFDDTHIKNFSSIRFYRFIASLEKTLNVKVKNIEKVVDFQSLVNNIEKNGSV